MGLGVGPVPGGGHRAAEVEGAGEAVPLPGAWVVRASHHLVSTGAVSIGAVGIGVVSIAVVGIGAVSSHSQ